MWDEGTEGSVLSVDSTFVLVSIGLDLARRWDCGTKGMVWVTKS